MSKSKNALRVIVLVLSLLLVLGGCNAMWEHLAGDNEALVRLTIGLPSNNRSISVETYNVTSVRVDFLENIQPPVPVEEAVVLESITWDAQTGPKTYMIPLAVAGDYIVRVTHISDENDQIVEATESAEFEIRPMVITRISIIPGQIGQVTVEPGEVEPCGDFIAPWYGEVPLPDFENGGVYPADMDFTVLDSVDIEMMARLPGTGEIVEDFSMKGTWACADEYITGVWTDAWSVGLNDWIPRPWDDLIHWSATYSVDGDTMSLNVDFEGNEPPVPMLTWEFTRP